MFTRNASEAINLVARSWGDANLKEGDEVLLTVMEHHSNLVPWQLLAERTGCLLRHVGLTEDGQLDLDDFRGKLSDRTRLVSLVHVSNTLGCCNPLEQVIPAAHGVGALVLVDACQSLAHQPIDVSALDADFLVGSSHKLCSPTGMGFLWGREALLEAIPPFLGGGEMIQDVYLDCSTWADLPHKFEAGTPAIGEAVGMGAALRYLQDIGLEAIQAWEAQLTRHLFARLKPIDGVQILARPPISNLSVVLSQPSSLMASMPDIAALMDASGICIRSGHHCCQPLHQLYGVTASAGPASVSSPHGGDRPFQ